MIVVFVVVNVVSDVVYVIDTFISLIELFVVNLEFLALVFIMILLKTPNKITVCNKTYKFSGPIKSCAYCELIEFCDTHYLRFRKNLLTVCEVFNTSRSLELYDTTKDTK